jgi:hypothetical protein
VYERKISLLNYKAPRNVITCPEPGAGKQPSIRNNLGVIMNKLSLPGPKAQALIERDRKFVSSSYPRGLPFVMDHGKGVEVWDPDGNRFIDFMAGIAVLSTARQSKSSSGAECV